MAQWYTPERIKDEWTAGARFKEGIGERGVVAQAKMNERFYIGDQWHGVRCSGERPLVRYNIIKRIGEYKLAMIAAAPIAVRYLAEGEPMTRETQTQVEKMSDAIRAGENSEITDNIRRGVVTEAMGDYFRVTAERVGFDILKETILRSAYIGGAGVLYTYWDERVSTGLYADMSRTKPLRGDLRCEALNMTQVVFGDPSVENIQEQPYILISQELTAGDVRREALRFGKRLKPDDLHVREDDENVTVVTKFYKAWDAAGQSCRVMMTKVCGDAVVRAPWDSMLRVYPLAKFDWERGGGCAYSDSEVTYLIPNQIAINRMMTASVWAMMLMGMPMMVVNGDVVTQPITNDPGQILKVFGTGEEVERAVRFVQPPAFSGAFAGTVNNLITHTLNQAGANDAALGDMRPDNAAAIVALREAATLPLQMLQNRFFAFCEDVARVWAEFWVRQYGKRSLKVEKNGEVWYVPFDGAEWEDLLLSVRVDVGPRALWSETQNVRTLDNLFARGIITPSQYLERMPDGMIERPMDIARAEKDLSFS